MEPGCSFHPCVLNCLFRSEKCWIFRKGGGELFFNAYFFDFQNISAYFGWRGVINGKEEGLKKTWTNSEENRVLDRLMRTPLAMIIFDAERASCLMNTQWHTVWSNRPISIANSTFPGLGFESQSRQLFVTWLQWQLILINQSIDQVIQTNILHWLIAAESWEKGKNRKNCLDWGSNLRPGNVKFEMELELPWCANRAVEEKRESALWLPIAAHCVPMGVH